MLNLTDRQQLIDYLKVHGLWLERSQGQHFLINEGVIEAIIAAVDLKPDATVLEIGPGVGTLTQALADVVPDGLVLGIERDQRLVDRLRTYFSSAKHVKIIHEDAVRYSLKELADQPYHVVANLPYQITGVLFRKFFEPGNAYPPLSATVMIQAEVADRILASAGSSDRSTLTVMVELFGDAKRVIDVPRGDFFPVPKVDSTVIRITRREPAYQQEEAEAILSVARAGFSAKRRTLSNALSANLRVTKDVINEWLTLAAINPQARAEELTLDNWQTLTKVISRQTQAKS